MDEKRWNAVRGAPLNALGDRLGVSFGREGPSIGPVALLHKVGGALAVRPIDELEYVLGLAFDQSVGAARYLPALEGIARALNAGDHAQAMLRTQLLNLPRLPEEDAYRRAVEAEEIVKASPNDPKHPGYPKGASDSRGGQFRPKDDIGDTAVQMSGEIKGAEREVGKRIVRRAVRAALGRMFKRRAGLLFVEAASNAVPVLGEIDDVIAAGQVLDMVRQSGKIYKEADVALDFFAAGHHDLDSLFASRADKEFPSFEAFKKTEDIPQEELERAFGPAGDGYEYHHIVEQGQGGVRFTAEQLNSTRNIVKIPKLLHEEITAAYSSSSADKSMGRTVRDTLRDKTFEEQWEHGVDTMRRMGIIK